MILHTDHHFIIGQNHVGLGMPCQDHALSGLIQQRAFAVVSDGCSGGGHTDIGSRLITTSTLKAMKMILPHDRDFIEEHISTIYDVACAIGNSAGQHLGLSSRDMLATQLFAIVEPSGKCSISIYGDGAIAFVNTDGEMTIHTFEWKNNFPFYPHEDRRRFIEVHGGKDELSLTQTIYSLLPNGTIDFKADRTFTCEAGCNGISFITDVITQKTAFVCLFSDGYAQVDKTDQLDVIRSLVAFKTVAGTFVKRRLIRFARDSKHDGAAGPLDDMGMAVIAIDHEDSE